MTQDRHPRRAIDAALLEELTALVARAGAAIMNFAPARVAQRAKADGSPVTAADEASDAVLADGLAQLLPGVAVVSEERLPPLPAQLGADLFVMVDPLDGTREFLAGRAEFTVNLALIRDGAPIAGIVAAPALGAIYRGGEGAPAERAPLAMDGAMGKPAAIRARAAPAARSALAALTSRSHLEPATIAYLDRLGVTERIGIGSAVKFCRLAEGAADLYPRLARVSEWDVAAGHAVLVAAGGDVTRPDGGAIVYGGGVRGDFEVRDFVAFADPALAKELAKAHGGGLQSH